MFKSLFASVVLAGAACAESLVPRADVPAGTTANGLVVVNALSMINAKTLIVDNMVRNLDILQATTLQLANFDVINTITDAIKNVTAIGNLELSDSGALTNAVIEIRNTVNQSIANAIQMKQNFGGLSPVVLNTLQKQQNATIQLSTTILGKLPSAIVGIAAQLNQPIFDNFTTGVDIFKQPNVNTDPTLYTTSAASISVVSGWTAALVAGTALLLI